MHVKIVKSDPKAREKPCLCCGYSLRKLQDARHCPECGLSIWLSLNQNDTLDWSRPQWLRRMSVAASVLAIGHVLALIGYGLLAYFVLYPAFNIAVSTSSIALDWKLGFWGIKAISVGVAVDHVGLLLLCVHERRYPDRLKAYRVFAMVMGVVGLLLGIGLLIMPHPSALLLSGFGTFAVGAILALSAVATFAFLRKLAQRVPNSLVSRLCGYILLGPLLGLVKSLPVFTLFYALPWLMMLVPFVPLVYGPLAIGLLLWFARRFAQCAGHAQVGWASETMAPQAVAAV